MIRRRITIESETLQKTLRHCSVTQTTIIDKSANVTSTGTKKTQEIINHSITEETSKNKVGRNPMNTIAGHLYDLPRDKYFKLNKNRTFEIVSRQGLPSNKQLFLCNVRNYIDKIKPDIDIIRLQGETAERLQRLAKVKDRLYRQIDLLFNDGKVVRRKKKVMTEDDAREKVIKRRRIKK